MKESPQVPIEVQCSWDQLGLSPSTLELLKSADYMAPTPVQAKAIPPALRGQDMIASAQTGTGKTLAFVLPMVERLAGRQGTYGLILCPTREIAQQTQATLEKFGPACGVTSIVLIGGVDMKIDSAALQTYPHIIVATPGRLYDHLERGNVWLDYIETVVLDEADRMLDMGFADQLNRIMEDTPSSRQTLLFSATISPQVERLAQRFLKKPLRITTTPKVQTPSAVEQRFIYVGDRDKLPRLKRLLEEEKGSIIVFVRSKRGASQVWRSLHSAGIYDATQIHSDLGQMYRERALADFKSSQYRILIATDVAGRGIHVDDVAHVVNYDLPEDAEDYVHRIGRTGRAQSTGHATSFVTAHDRDTLKQIERLLGVPIAVEGVKPLEPARDRHPRRFRSRNNRR